MAHPSSSPLDVPLVPTGDFTLAWSELDYIYALLVRSRSR